MYYKYNIYDDISKLIIYCGRFLFIENDIFR